MSIKDKLPNQLLYLGFVTVEDIMGLNGLNSILNYAKLKKYIGNYPPNNLTVELDTKDFTDFLTGMINVLGENGAKIVMLQAGRRSFEIMLKEFPTLFNLEGVKPQERTADKMFEEYIRISGIVVEAAKGIFGADIYNRYETDEGLASEISPCYWCYGLKASRNICHAEVGFESGLAKWIFGKEVRIEETHCIAHGDDMCRFLLYRPA